VALPVQVRRKRPPDCLNTELPELRQSRRTIFQIDPEQNQRFADTIWEEPSKRIWRCGFREDGGAWRPMTDQEAVAKLLAHDIAGLETLVRRYHTQAMQTAYLIVGDWALAEDVAQSAFVNAYERIGRFDNTRPFAPWFLRTVVNIALKVSAGRRELSLDEQRESSGLDIPATEPGILQVLEAAETREEILTALHKLSPDQRAAIVMKYYLDLSDLDAAARLNVPAGTIRRRLHDARKRLRQLLPMHRRE
jgi:RNA polymerase sigma-70 factor, ECF subfamily